MAVADRVADERDPGAAVLPTTQPLVRRDRRRTRRERHFARGVNAPRHRRSVRGEQFVWLPDPRDAVRGHVDADAGLGRVHAEREHRAGSAQKDVAVRGAGQGGRVDQHPGHVRQRSARARVTERLTHHRLPAVRADDESGRDANRAPAIRRHGRNAAAGHFRHPAARQQCDFRPRRNHLPTRFDDQVVLTADAELATDVRQNDRFAALGEDGEPAAEGVRHAGRGQIDAEVREDARAGRVQPLAREPAGRGVGVDEADAGTRFGEREGGRAAHRPAADDGHVGGDVRRVGSGFGRNG